MHSLPWSYLPQTARIAALMRWSRNRPGPGDGFIYSYLILTPPPGYHGPLPVCAVTGRRREKHV
jgi:hypothetical protein